LLLFVFFVPSTKLAPECEIDEAHDKGILVETSLLVRLLLEKLGLQPANSPVIHGVT